jgi:hypothetical protein
MALKGHRFVVHTDVSHFMNEVAERGGLAVHASTANASGMAMDQGTNLVTYAANPSGLKVAGVLMNDMVNIDQTRQHINYHKDEVQKGGKVTILKIGEVLTNMVYPGVSPGVGDPAYVHHSGYVHNTVHATGGLVYTPLVGRFLTKKDEDGYAKLWVNIT